MPAGVLLVVATACGGSHYATSPTTPARNVVSATPSLLFDPVAITIAAGDSVTWAFGGVAHTVTFQHDDDSGSGHGDGTSAAGVPADIPSTTSGSVTRVFTNRGAFAYRCTLHPGMRGAVQVQ